MNVSEELRKFAEEFAGNWREFECFAWHDDDIEEPEKWGVPEYVNARQWHYRPVE